MTSVSLATTYAVRLTHEQVMRFINDTEYSPSLRNMLGDGRSEWFKVDLVNRAITESDIASTSHLHRRLAEQVLLDPLWITQAIDQAFWINASSSPKERIHLVQVDHLRDFQVLLENLRFRSQRTHVWDVVCENPNANVYGALLLGKDGYITFQGDFALERVHAHAGECLRIPSDGFLRALRRQPMGVGGESGSYVDPSSYSPNPGDRVEVRDGSGYSWEKRILVAVIEGRRPYVVVTKDTERRYPNGSYKMESFKEMRAIPPTPRTMSLEEVSKLVGTPVIITDVIDQEFRRGTEAMRFEVSQETRKVITLATYRTTDTLMKEKDEPKEKVEITWKAYQTLQNHSATLHHLLSSFRTLDLISNEEAGRLFQ